jgi:hypothetical protein
MPGLNVGFTLSVEGHWGTRRVSYTGRWQVNHIKVLCARDCAMQDHCATAGCDPAGVTVKVASVIAAAI